MDKKRANESTSSDDVTGKRRKTTDSCGGGLADALTCAICSEILHNAATAMPCLHNFCAGCISQWAERSTQCPTCRGQMQTIRRNAQLCSMVEIYSATSGAPERSKDDTAALDAADRITKAPGAQLDLAADTGFLLG